MLCPNCNNDRIDYISVGECQCRICNDIFINGTVPISVKKINFMIKNYNDVINLTSNKMASYKYLCRHFYA